MTSRILLSLQVLATAAVVSRLRSGARRELPVQATGQPVPPDVSVIIPARNEAERISDCLRGLPIDELCEVIVVDDESTDDTAEIARSHGAKVVSGSALPDGWVGKPWALQQGLEAAKGEWLIFLDADTIPQPGLIASLIEHATKRNAQILTLAPRFQCDSMAQQVLHASMLTTLVYRFLPVGTTSVASPSRTIGNGQCLVARREWLESEGGFLAARTNMTDDIALVRSFAARGCNVVFADGADVLQVKMHTSLGEVWREWGRSLPMPDVTPKPVQYADLATIWLTMVLPLWRIVLRRSSGLDKALMLLRLCVCLALGRSYASRRGAIWLSPLADTATAIRLTQTTWRPVRSWKGRNYPPGETAGR